jgi:hypothetical protein
MFALTEKKNGSTVSLKEKESSFSKIFIDPITIKNKTHKTKEHQVMIKVYIVQYEFQADEKVFFVDYEFQADENVQVVEYDFQADKKVFPVQYDFQADKKVFRVRY